MVSWLIRDSLTDALVSSETYFGATADFVFAHRLDYEERAPSTGPVTFKIRAAPGTGSFTLNGSNNAAYLGGTLNSFLSVKEIMA